MTRIPVIAMEFVEGGDTIWIHGLMGTVLRIKTTGKITSKACVGPGSHVDMMVEGDISICLGIDSPMEDEYLGKVEGLIKDMLQSHGLLKPG